MLNLSIQKTDIKLNCKHSKINVLLSDYSFRYQIRSLLERLDYLGINAAILDYGESEAFFSLEINTVDLFTVKRCKKVIETLFSGSVASIDNIGGMPYKEYMYNIGA